MTQPDAMMTRIAEASGLGQRGERAQARDLLGQLWEQIGAGGSPLHRCALAHSMADVQDDPAHELVWDQRALAAADEATDAEAVALGMPGLAGTYPSLHLNLGDVHLRLGDRGAARRHLLAGLAALDGLADDGYGAMVRRGLRGLQQRLDQPVQQPRCRPDDGSAA